MESVVAAVTTALWCGVLGQMVRLSETRSGSIKRRSYNQRMPTTAVAEDGSFLVLWRDGGYLFYGAEKSDIMGRLYEADGAARTDEFVVAPTQAGYPFAPRVAALPGGGYADERPAASTNSHDIVRYSLFAWRRAVSTPYSLDARDVETTQLD